MRIYELLIEPEREDHIACHNVAADEVQEVVTGNVFIRKARQGYLRLIGQTGAGRYLTVFVVSRGGGTFGLVTARDATQAERRAYRKHQGR